jgi:hypothetical protein
MFRICSERIPLSCSGQFSRLDPEGPGPLHRRPSSPAPSAARADQRQCSCPIDAAQLRPGSPCCSRMPADHARSRCALLLEAWPPIDAKPPPSPAQPETHRGPKHARHLETAPADRETRVQPAGWRRSPGTRSVPLLRPRAGALVLGSPQALHSRHGRQHAAPSSSAGRFEQRPAWIPLQPGQWRQDCVMDPSPGRFETSRSSAQAPQVAVPTGALRVLSRRRQGGVNAVFRLGKLM